jgi:hypothetical protein
MISHKVVHTLAAAALALAGSLAQAQQVDTMNFQGVNATSTQSGNEVLNYYNGGISQVGTTGGAALDFGIAFGSGGVADSVLASSANFTANPSASNDVLFFKPTGVSAANDSVNDAAGFTALSFNYSSQATADSVSFYSGVNGTGSLLATVSLGDNTGTSFGCTAAKAYCKWTASTTTLGAGQVAESAVFNGATGSVYFDSLAVTAVPEPGPWALTALGLVAVAAGLRARRKS